MKTKKKPKYKKFLRLHRAWSKTGRITEARNPCFNGGLCGSPVYGTKQFDLMMPTPEDGEGSSWWGFSNDKDDIRRAYIHQLQQDYTPLRQTIVLLCAAMNNEL